MATYRVHAETADFDGMIPYMTLTRVDHSRVQFVLSDLAPDLAGLSLCLNLDTIYRLLEGKSVCVDLPIMSCTLTPEDDALRLHAVVQDRGIRLDRRVSLSELGSMEICVGSE